MTRVFFVLLCMNICLANAALRDPTTPIGQDRVTIDNVNNTNLSIQGLFVSKSKRVALINNKFYVVGDLTEQGKLVAILKDRVIVKQGDSMKVIFMSQQKVLQDR